MWSLEVNKIFAAVLCAVWMIWLVNFIGDQLIPSTPSSHATSQTAKAEKPAAKPKKQAPKAAKQAAKPAPKEAAQSPVLASIGAADAGKGRKLVKKCLVCHTIKKGAKHRIGPNIWGALGGPRGVVAGYKYSKPMKELGGRWSYQDMDKYLTKPMEFLPKGKMGFPGMKKVKDRAHLIKFLRTLSDKPLPLP